MHGAEGHLKDYRPLLAHLGEGQAAYGLTAFDEGWQSRDLDALLQRYVQSIPESLKQRPLVLLGWCLASRLALLLTAHLQAAGFNVQALAVVDHDSQRSLAGDGDEGGSCSPTWCSCVAAVRGRLAIPCASGWPGNWSIAIMPRGGPPAGRRRSARASAMGGR
ncbi:thioesterase domain-containing protein [Pseudomonas sp. OHS18]|uniref:thioesterase domain-containing protein n=1 Tax=Pseudomonas sp. OHS18 TaxID=3399679 RepID=UPI003A887D96